MQCIVIHLQYWTFGLLCVVSAAHMMLLLLLCSLVKFSKFDGTVKIPSIPTGDCKHSMTAMHQYCTMLKSTEVRMSCMSADYNNQTRNARNSEVNQHMYPCTRTTQPSTGSELAAVHIGLTAPGLREMSFKLLSLCGCVDDGAASQEREQQQIEYNCFCFPGGEEESVFIPDGEQEDDEEAESLRLTDPGAM